MTTTERAAKVQSRRTGGGDRLKQTTFWIVAIVALAGAFVLFGLALALGFIIGAVLAAMILPAVLKGLPHRMMNMMMAFWLSAIVLGLIVYILLGGAWAVGLLVGMVFGEIWG